MRENDDDWREAIVVTTAVYAPENRYTRMVTVQYVIGSPDGLSLLIETYKFRHTNAAEEQHGKKQLAALCRVCGIEGPLTDSDDLHNVPFHVRMEAGRIAEFAFRSSWRIQNCSITQSSHHV